MKWQVTRSDLSDWAIVRWKYLPAGDVWLPLTNGRPFFSLQLRSIPTKWQYLILRDEGTYIHGYAESKKCSTNKIYHFFYNAATGKRKKIVEDFLMFTALTYFYWIFSTKPVNGDHFLIFIFNLYGTRFDFITSLEWKFKLWVSYEKKLN